MISGKQESTYIKTIIDTIREPILILNENFQIKFFNESFIRTFQLDSSIAEKLIYKLGDGGWDIPMLHQLLEDILIKNDFFNGYELSADFPIIGHKVMILNARKIKFDLKNEHSLILLAMEDVTELMIIAEKLAGHASQLENKIMERVLKLEIHLKKLEIEVDQMKLQAL